MIFNFLIQNQCFVRQQEQLGDGRKHYGGGESERVGEEVKNLSIYFPSLAIHISSRLSLQILSMNFHGHASISSYIHYYTATTGNCLSCPCTDDSRHILRTHTHAKLLGTVPKEIILKDGGGEGNRETFGNKWNYYSILPMRDSFYSIL